LKNQKEEPQLAKLHTDIWAIHLDLNEQETQKLLESTDLVATLMGIGVVFPPPVNILVAAFAMQIKLYKWIIPKVDKGNGIRLTRTHLGWLVIPIIPTAL
jgi:hypothetical protein